MASPEFQPPAPRGPEFRPGPQVSMPETVGRSVEAAPNRANLTPVPGPSPASSPADNSRTLVTDPAPKRSTFSLGRSSVRLPERADAGGVLVDRAIQVVSEIKEPALQKDALSRIMEVYPGANGSSES